LKPKTRSKSRFSPPCLDPPPVKTLTDPRSENRVRSLYDDFTRLAQIDPAGYRANIDAWRQALLAAAQAGVIRGARADAGRFVVETGDSLLRDLDTRQFGRPQGLARVLVRRD
jgi:charged multivesicular body protein 7